MSIGLPDLPYDTHALEPFMSSETLELHHGKHHAGYVDKLNELIDGTPYAGMRLEDIVLRSNKLLDGAVFNNAAQALNHDLFWNSMAPSSSSPDGALQKAITRDFGSIDRLRKELRFSAVTLFGSGWVWLVSDAGKLRVVSTSNADTPIVQGAKPLLTLDVWEHAYYLDVKNDRPAYVDTFLNELIDWSAASRRYDARREAA